MTAKILPFPDNPRPAPAADAPKPEFDELKREILEFSEEKAEAEWQRMWHRKHIPTSWLEYME